MLANRRFLKRMNLVLGAGFLSGYITELFSEVKTISVCRIQKNFIERNNETFFYTDVLKKGCVSEFQSRISNFNGFVFFLIPPSSFSDRPIELTLGPLFEFLSTVIVKRVVVVSSTGVYSDLAGQTVTNLSKVEGSSSRVKRLLEIEKVWLSSPFNVVVARLGGLYGKGRIVGEKLLKSGEEVPGTGEEHLNLIHVRDAARALLRLTQSSFKGKRYIVTDRLPVRRCVYYQYLANKLGISPPNFSGSTRGSYLCDSTATWRSLGIEPEFMDYRFGLEGLI